MSTPANTDFRGSDCEVVAHERSSGKQVPGPLRLGSRSGRRTCVSSRITTPHPASLTTWRRTLKTAPVGNTGHQCGTMPGVAPAPSQVNSTLTPRSPQLPKLRSCGLLRTKTRGRLRPISTASATSDGTQGPVIEVCPDSSSEAEGDPCWPGGSLQPIRSCAWEIGVMCNWELLESLSRGGTEALVGRRVTGMVKNPLKLRPAFR